MKPFHTIAVPHKDILEGRLTMDVFAADLWEVCQKRGPEEYKDNDTFFQKTYVTHGLNNLLSVVQKRLSGKGGDPVIQIQTPFGGGKTHSLIALYHKCQEWKTKSVVIVGTVLSSKDTFWGIIEKQLTGKIKQFTGKVSPGKEALRALLSEHQPALILMDEVLEYATKAAGEMVGESSLASQTIAFMQELSEAVATLEKMCLVVTLPSSVIEHYDEHAERLFQQLQKVSGRVEKIYTPVEDNEITKIIRQRLFSNINEKEVKQTVSAFVEFAQKENMLPAGVQPSEYRDRFIDSFPFMPDLVDVLYHRWGTFPSFQRTRGVLRLLSLLVYSVKEKNIPFISPADYSLGDQEIRQEFIKHIGSEFNGVIASDITDVNSGARKVDASLGDAYKGLSLSVRTATAMFLYSFSGGVERGATVTDIKRCATTMGNPASVVSEALEQLKSRLFYMQNVADKYFFSNQPNLNRIVLTKMENIKDADAVNLEKEILRSNLGSGCLKVFIWETNSVNIADTEDLKLLILKQENKELINEIITSKGQTPRVYRNTLFFLHPIESERSPFERALKKKIAYEYIESDSNLRLTDEQRKIVKAELRRLNDDVSEHLRRFYRLIAIPQQNGFKTVDLGIPTYGDTNTLDNEVYDKLRSDGEVIERIAPIVIREKYLTGKECVLTEQLYQATLRVPGETRMINSKVLESGIEEGVRSGVFGLGDLEADKPICRYFKETPTIALSDGEIIIAEAICREQKKKEEQAGIGFTVGDEESHEPLGIAEGGEASPAKGKVREKVHLRFFVPKGKMSGLMGTLGYLQTKFDKIKMNIYAEEGKISEQEFEDRIEETFRQLGIDLEDV